MFKLKINLWASLFLSVSAGIISCSQSPGELQNKTRNIKSAGILVEGIIAKKENISEEIQVTGNIIPNEEVEIKSEIQGKIIEINFPEGGSVSKGQVIALIDARELNAQLSKANANYNLIKERESRQNKLLEIKAISQEEYELSKNDLQNALAEIEILKSRLAKTILTAPFDGVAGLKLISEGSIANIAQPITTVQQVDPLKLDFFVPEKYFGMVKKGDTVLFSTNNSSREYKARIIAFESKLDPINRTMKVRAIFNNSMGLNPGSFANIKVKSKTIAGVLIPAESLIPDSKGYKIFISDSGKTFYRTVETGMRTAKSVEIIKGLNEGDTVLTSGLMHLKQGNPVKVVIKNL